MVLHCIFPLEVVPPHAKDLPSALDLDIEESDMDVDDDPPNIDSANLSGTDNKKDRVLELTVAADLAKKNGAGLTRSTMNQNKVLQSSKQNILPRKAPTKNERCNLK